MRDLKLCRLPRKHPRQLPWVRAEAFFAALLLLSILPSIPCRAETQPAAAPAPAPTTGEAPPKLNLADLVPKAQELNERKARLEARIAKVTATDDVEATLSELRERYAASTAALQSLETAGDYTLDQLTPLKVSLRRDFAAIDAVVAELTRRMGEIASGRKEWSELGALWTQWETELPTTEVEPTVRLTFVAARAAVGEASSLLLQAVPKVVQAQRAAVDLQAQFQELWKRVEGLAERLKEGLFGLWSPSMLNRQFWEQFAGSLRGAVAGPQGETPGLRPQVSANWVWIVLLHVSLAAAFALGLRLSRTKGPTGEKWRALLDHPFAAGVLAGVLFPLAFYSPAQNLPAHLGFGLALAAGLAAVRLAPRLIASHALRRMLVVSLGVFLVDRLLRTLGLPTPLLRSYNALIGAAGAALCVLSAELWRKRGEPLPFIIAGRAGGALLAVACVAQVSGYSSLGFRLVDGLVRSTFLLPLGWMFSLLLRGWAELLLERALLARWNSLRTRGGEILRTLGIVTDGVTLCLFSSFLLSAWQLVDVPIEATRFLLGLGFDWGEQRVTVGLVLAAFAALYLSLATSRVVQAVLEGQVYPQRKVDWGVRISINRLIQYAFILVGVLMALGTLGIELGKLAVVAGALGVGIGFGLQAIVNNFVSGLILLFERPLKVGDVLQLGEDWGKVTQLGLRATTIQTFDRSEIIVPNSELVTGRVINWTHSDRTARILLPVGVAYGSDVAGVMRILEEVAAAHPKVASDPKPEAFFRRFGESSLDFQLMAWVWNIDDRLKTQSELLEGIDRRFREAGIVIPFPQHVVHVPKEEGGSPAAETKRPATPPDAET